MAATKELGDDEEAKVVGVGFVECLEVDEQVGQMAEMVVTLVLIVVVRSAAVALWLAWPCASRSINDPTEDPTVTLSNFMRTVELKARSLRDRALETKYTPYNQSRSYSYWNNQGNRPASTKVDYTNQQPKAIE